MTVRFAKGIAAIDVFALRDMRARSSLAAGRRAAQFKRLVLDAVTLIVEEQLAGGIAPGGRHVDGEDDGDGDGARLHVWLEPSATACRLLILRFDQMGRTPPIVTDTMAIVHGERELICRFVVYREARTGSVNIEMLPAGRLSDERRPAARPGRPAAAVKPLLHRVEAALRRWLAQLPPSQSRLQAA